MPAYKLIFAGPVGAGKSTAIAAISDIEPFTTEETATDETKQRKELTTVAMDYGMLKLESGERIHLYGTPGQTRFDFMWDILTEGGLGMVLLIDNAKADPFTDMQFYLDAFKPFVERGAVAIGVTRTDLSPRPGIADYHRVLGDQNINVPVFSVDGREHNDIIMLVQALMFSLDPGVREQA